MNRGTTAGIFTEDGYMNFRSEDLGLKSVFRNYSDNNRLQDWRYWTSCWSPQLAIIQVFLENFPFRTAAC